MLAAACGSDDDDDDCVVFLVVSDDDDDNDCDVMMVAFRFSVQYVPQNTIRIIRRSEVINSTGSHQLPIPVHAIGTVPVVWQQPVRGW